MPTNTTRLGLVKPLTSENYDVAVHNGNMDIIDAAPANFTICTNSTRPSTPDDGDAIFETDTNNGLIRHSSAWKAMNGRVFLCTSSTNPASGVSFGGMVIFETDTGVLKIRNSANGAWLTLTLPTTGNAGTTVQFTSTGTWTKPASLVWAIVELQGSGGGGGGAGAAAGGNGATGAGGGAGGWGKKLFLASALASTETVTIGSAGTGGGAGANNGVNGGVCSFATGKAYVLTASAGVGGTGGAASGSYVRAAGGAGGAFTGGDLNVTGDTGEHAFGAGGNPAPYSNGASSAWGAGGVVPTTDGAGGNATGFGAGGAGGIVYAGAGGARAGGNGSAGMCLVTHYF